VCVCVYISVVADLVAAVMLLQYVEMSVNFTFCERYR